MASSCNRFIGRASLQSLKSVIRSTARTASINRSAPSFPLPTRSSASPLRFSLSRSPSELGCVQSMLPLHSAVAVARMTSCLSSTTSSCRALSQELGLSVPR
ncbi:protein NONRESPONDING TO OXYLIPINS 2, mitochondrial-like isoform X2 [Malania oleifera]|uniref:protein NONRESPONDING TO OXYLIPINS 2, mitochondrial-like isoform X2 n=1 Tax=Malania oleifera TaxID=397392 RepID=UPI0025AE341C|nr:protein NONRESPONDING TO OXYLIPINS 2, mitochondrial-like isoform X2 [Malania oleifera]